MKISFNQKVAVVFGLIIVALWLIEFVGESRAVPAKPANVPAPTNANFAAAPPVAVRPPAAKPAVAPFVITDTDTDSPGTNIVTRIVTFTASIGGTPRPALQWRKVSGNDFVDVAGATNTTLRIGNAQVADSGFYELFATNTAGSVHTTPQQLVVTEGED